MNEGFGTDQEELTAQEKLAMAFRAVVDTAVQPVLAKQKSNEIVTYDDPSVEVARPIRSGSDELTFARHIGSAGIAGALGLDFVPSHSLSITTRRETDDAVMSNTVFGLRADGLIIRNLETHPDVIRPDMQRPLDEEESQALIEYARDPDSHREQRELALRYTPAELAHLNQRIIEDKKATASLRQQLNNIKNS